jgi:hypothetical protein
MNQFKASSYHGLLVKDLAAPKRAFLISTAAQERLSPFMTMPIEDALSDRAFWRAAFRHSVYPATLFTMLAVSQPALIALSDALEAGRGDPVSATPVFKASERVAYYGETVQATFKECNPWESPSLHQWLEVATEEAATDPAFWLAAFHDPKLRLVLEPALMRLVFDRADVQMAIFEAAMATSEVS